MERLFVECAVRAALVAIVTAVVLRTVGIRSAAARHKAWTSVMLTMLFLPVWTAWGPKAPLRLLPPVERHISVQAPVQSAAPPSVRLTEMQPVQTAASQPTGHHWTWESLVLLVYGLGVCALLARLAIGTARTHRLRMRANVRDGRGVSSECASPVTVGWFHPVVILPGNWQEWAPQQLDAVLTHEREHVRRRDPLVQWLALVNRAVFWFHPLSWWLEGKLSELAEETCDAAVLTRGHAPEEYSEYLLDIARSVVNSGARLSLVGMAMPGSFLQQRIRQILNSCSPRPISRARVLVTVVACASASILLASGTLDHARAHLSPAISQTGGVKAEVVPPAAPVQESPRVLLAQAVPRPVPANPPALALQQAGSTPQSASADPERQLLDAFQQGVPATDIPIAMEINYFQLNRAEYSVPLTIKIPGSELSLARNAGSDRTSFDFLCEVKDEYGAVVSNLRDRLSIDLSGMAVNRLASTPVEYDAGLKLLPGRYSIKLTARNIETGRTGNYESAFTVPNLNKEEQGVPISSVVLSSQRVEVANAGDRLQAANPLVADGRKLVPSVTRVFSKSREMYVYLQAYQHEAGTIQPVVAYATFYQGQAKVMETAPIQVTEGTDSRSRAVPLSLSISLAALKPGEYTCEITVKSPNTLKTAQWQAPIVIEP